MGLFFKIKPRLKVLESRADRFNGWIKCKKCHEMVHGGELDKNLQCCPKCDHHFPMSAEQRIELLADPGSFQKMHDELISADPLNFVDSQDYPSRIKKAQESAKASDAVYVGRCTMQGTPVALGVMNFNFMAGSMGSVVGERLARLIEDAIEQKSPVVIVSASGGSTHAGINLFPYADGKSLGGACSFA